MKQFNLAITLLTISGLLFSCDNKAKETKTDNQNIVEVVEQSVEKKATDAMQDTIQFTWVKPTSSINRIKNNSDGPVNNRHTLNDWKSNNVFSIDDNTINMRIPVTTNNMEVIGVTNVSSSNLNAIIVHLDGNNGGATIGIKATHIIEVEFPLKKIFLKTTKLEADKKIIVKVLHDNDVATVNQMTQCLKKCIEQDMSNYSEYNKDCMCNEKILKDEQPKEVDGSILKGGN